MCHCPATTSCGKHILLHTRACAARSQQVSSPHPNHSHLESMQQKMSLAPRIRITTLLLLSAIVFNPTVNAAAQEAIRYYEDAVARFVSEDFKGAAIQLKNALQQDPAHIAAKILLGRTHLTLGYPLAAEEELLQAEILGADPQLIVLPLARARNQLGKFRLNIENVRPNSFPASLAGDLWVELGSARLSGGDPAGAQIAFEKAAKQRPRNTPAILGLGSVALQRKDFGKAQEYCQQALATDPANPDAWFMTGALQEAQGHIEAAIEHYREALRLRPGHYKAAMGEAIIMMNKGRPAEAAVLFEKITSAHPWQLEAIYLHSQALSQSGRELEADSVLQHGADLVSKVEPADLKESPRLLSLAALVASEARQYGTARGFLERYLTYRPDDVTTRMRMAEILSRTGEPLKAVSELTKLANRYPDAAEVHIQLGDANGRLGDFEAAVKNYETALSLRPASTELVSKLGLAQQLQGRTDLAIATMSRLLESAPGTSARAAILLGTLYFEQGDFAKARQITDELVALYPDNLLAINLQAAVVIAQGDRKLGRQLLESILNAAPDFEPAQFNLIQLDLVDGRYAEARSALDAQLASNPDRERVALAFADYAIASNDSQRAIELLVQIREKNPRSVKAILKLSELYVRTGRANDAIASLHTLDETVPNNFDIKLKLAELRLARGETDAARSILVDTASLAGSHLPKRLTVAEMQIQAGAVDDAIQGLQRAIIERPEVPAPKLLMAQIHARQERLGQADELTSQVVEQHPANLAAVTLLADIRLARGRPEEAIRLYRRGMRIADKPELAISLYRAQNLAGHNRQALNELAVWYLRNPDNTPIMRFLADQYIKSGRTAEALALYEQLSIRLPADAEVHNNLSNLLLPLDSERALQTALRAYEIAPENPAVLDTLGWIRVQLGDLEKGLAHLREAVVRDTSVPEVRYHLAVALEEYGDTAAARRQLRLALGMGKAFPERELALQRLARLESPTH